MSAENSSPGGAVSGAKALGSTALIVILLTAAIWIFFYYKNQPLDPPGTVVVALAMILLVSLGRWLWARSRRPGSAK